MRELTWFEKLIDKVQTYFRDRKRAKHLLRARCKDCMGELFPVVYENSGKWETYVACCCAEINMDLYWWFPDKREASTVTKKDFIKHGFYIE